MTHRNLCSVHVASVEMGGKSPLYCSIQSHPVLTEKRLCNMAWPALALAYLLYQRTCTLVADGNGAREWLRVASKFRCKLGGHNLTVNSKDVPSQTVRPLCYRFDVFPASALCVPYIEGGQHACDGVPNGRVCEVPARTYARHQSTSTWSAVRIQPTREKEK